MNAKKNKGLGKGLSALFGDQKKPENIDKIEDNVQKALIGELARNKYQPRSFFDEDKLKELSQSIKKMESFSQLRFVKTILHPSHMKLLLVKEDG